MQPTRGCFVKSQATREMADTKSIERRRSGTRRQVRRLREHNLRVWCDVTDRAAVRLASWRGTAPKRTHVIERGLYCFLELGALHVLRRSGIPHRSPVLLHDRR